MVCLLKHTITRTLGALLCLGTVLATPPHRARAQVTFRLSTDDILSAVRVRYDTGAADASGALPVLNNRLSAGFSFLVPSPRLTMAGDARAVVSLEPEVAVNGTDAAGTSVQTALGTRFMPAATLGVLTNPSERLEVGVFGHAALIADMTPGDGVFATNLPDTSPDAGTMTGNTGTGAGASVAAGSPVTPALPANSWVTEVGALARAGLTPTVKPALGVQYRVFRYLDRYQCATSVALDGTLPPQNYENDALVLDSRWAARASERIGYAAELRARRDINRPYATCVDSVASGVADIYNQINPAATFFTGERTWHVAVRPGVAFLWGTTSSSATTAQEPTGLRVLPTGTVLGSRRFERGDVSARAGLEAATLFGQSAPTYNAGADFQASWKPRERWTLRGGAAYLRTMPLEPTTGVDTSTPTNAMTLWTASTGIAWLPRPWMTWRLDYMFSYQLLDLDQADGQGTADAATPTRLRWHVLSLAASFVLGGGLGTDWKPRIEAGMGR